MELRDLRYFVTLADELHFRRAAERLHLSQPAVSQWLKGFERELGLALFDRSNRRVELTEAGRRLLAASRPLLEHADSVSAAMRDLRRGSTGSVVLGLTPALAPAVLPSILGDFRSRAPDVEVATRSLAEAAVPRALTRGEVDVCLTGVVPGPGYAAVPVTREPLGVALPTSSPLSRRRSVTPRELDGHQLVWMARASAPELYDDVLGRLREAGFRPGAVHESQGAEASLALVAAGVGVSLKTRAEVDRFGGARRGVRWVAVAGVDLAVEVHAVWRPDRVRPPLVQLIRLLRDRAAQAATSG